MLTDQLREQLGSSLAGRYEIEREAGAGGMATVYLARDLKHARRVALKVLHPDLAAALGAERFLAEIRTTANLQHPHILPLHDSGEADGFLFYVMPFVEGETLRARLEREQLLPIDDALRIAREMLSALDYAHRHGVVHRDIKPENILLHDGSALVADFGIALAVTAAGGQRMTQTGLSLGTPQYMSPEQAMGERQIDGRADIYAAGAVLYEMLTGEPPFSGASVQAIVAKVMTERPTPPSTVRDTVPLHVEASVLRALAKLPADRFAAAADFAAALAATATSGVAHAQGSGARMVESRSRAASWLADRRTIATLVAAGLLVTAAALRPRASASVATSGTVTRLRIVPADTTPGLINQYVMHGTPAVSPDGRIVAFSVGKGDTTALFVQPLDRFEQWAVAGGGRVPFFSPDGRWIGYLRGGSVWKVGADGGDPIRLGAIMSDSRAWDIRGEGVWHPNGRIYFGTNDGVISLPSAGGAATRVSLGDTGGGTPLQRLDLTPDGRLLGVTMHGGRARMAIVSPDGSGLHLLPEDIESPAWFVGDLLVFTRERQRYVSAFDLDGLRPVGEAVAIGDFPNVVFVAPGTTAAWFDPSSSRRLEPVWVSRTGQATPIGLSPDGYRWPRISPDGRRAALFADGWNSLGVVDLATGGRLRLTGPDGGGGGRTEPVWFRDGSRVLSSASVKGMYALVTQVADGSRAPDTLIAPARGDRWPTDVSPGDSLVLFYGTPPGGDDNNVFVLNVRTKALRHIAQPGAQRGARFSPDGRWIAMESRQGGRSEVIVQPWPALDALHVVSPEGGEEPAWSRDGRELYYRSLGRVMAAKVAAGSAWRASPPVELFRGPYASDMYGDQSYDVAPDGRFLMLRFSGESPLQIRVIRNWAAELRRKLSDAQP